MKIFAFDAATFWSVTAALLFTGVIFGLFAHVLDHNGQKITGAKSPDATFDNSNE